MQQSRGFQPFLACAVLLLALLQGACAKPQPEQAVRAQLQALQAAIDARDAGAVNDLLAEDFVGNEGMDPRAVRQLATGAFLRYRDVAARIGPVDVQLRGTGSASANFSVLLTGGSGGLLPEQGQVYEVQTGWRERGGEWQLVNANWKPRL